MVCRTRRQSSKSNKNDSILKKENKTEITTKSYSFLDELKRHLVILIIKIIKFWLIILG